MTPTFALWASSSPAPKEDLAKGLARCESLGWSLYVPKQTKAWATRPESKTRHYLAGSDQGKVESLADIHEQKEIQNVLMVRGGYGAIRLLPWLQRRGLLKKFNKRIWGFSDLTVIQNALYQSSGLAWVHSPMLTSASFHSPNAAEKAHWKKLLSGETVELSLKHFCGPQKDLQGVLVGGNLASLVSLAGTPWQPYFSTKHILFLEEVNEAPHRLDRLLQQLVLSKMLGKTRAVVLGHFTDCPKAHAIIQKWANECQLAVYRGLKSGHEKPNLALPMGQKIEIQNRAKSLASLALPKINL